MIAIRRSEDRGKANYGWLDTHYTFSFSQYFDPKFMGFRSLRVINEDEIAPSGGFPMHPHDNMEILTYVTRGTLRHSDSEGNGGEIRPGLLQRMSAGRGIRHSEFNPSKTDATHLLQIWITPAERNLPPGYEQIEFDLGATTGRLVLLASPDVKQESATIKQDVYLYAGRGKGGQTFEYPLSDERYAWIQVIEGKIEINGETVSKGDGAAIQKEKGLRIQLKEASEFLLFDLA
jgi:redox-sensitive bicupin YhaK (pirin superfamily)